MQIVGYDDLDPRGLQRCPAPGSPLDFEIGGDAPVEARQWVNRTKCGQCDLATPLHRSNRPARRLEVRMRDERDASLSLSLSLSPSLSLAPSLSLSR